MDAFSREHKDCLVMGQLVSFSYFGFEMLKRMHRRGDVAQNPSSLRQNRYEQNQNYECIFLHRIFDMRSALAGWIE
jgi:hypothetical protein